MSELAKVACYSSSMPDREAFSSCGVMGVVRMLFDFESLILRVGLASGRSSHDKLKRGEPYRSRLSSEHMLEVTNQRSECF